MNGSDYDDNDGIIEENFENLLTESIALLEEFRIADKCPSRLIVILKLMTCGLTLCHVQKSFKTILMF